MLPSITRFLDFNAWANARVAAAIRDDSEQPLRLFGHVVRTETLYLERMRGADPWPQDFWPNADLPSLVVETERSMREYRELLAPLSAADLERRVAYRTSAGVRRTSSLDEMVTHVTLHGVHHRSQIATLLRQRGASPPVQDFIAYLREREANA